MRWFLVLFVLSKIALAQEYVIDNAHSSVSFLIKHLSVADTMGIFQDFSGNISINDGKITKLNGNVKIDSINTFNSARDSNITSDRSFFVNKEATLTLISASKDHILARLTINNISKDISFYVKITGPIMNPNIVKNTSSKQDHKNPLIHQPTQDNNIFVTQRVQDDCGCYVTYGDNVIGIELLGRINRFDFNISKDTPKELLGEYIDIRIILEASR